MNTHASLVGDLRALGLRAGMIVMTHSSLRAIGWTEGGAETVVRALLGALGPGGTLVTPAETPAVGESADWDTIDGQPVWRGAGAPRLFDPDLTPTTMGAVAEAARTFRATRRSRHPLVSVCANGARAEAIVRDHPLPFCEGAGGPFERLYELDAHTLLLGVGFDRCTSLHYAESLTPRRRTKLSRYPMRKDGELAWIEAPDMAADNGVHFPIVGQQFMETGEVRQGAVGQAPSLFFSTRALVDFAQQYFSRTL